MAGELEDGLEKLKRVVSFLLLLRKNTFPLFMLGYFL